MIDKAMVYRILAQWYANLNNTTYSVEVRNRAKNYIKVGLDIPTIHWGVRAIYIKLFLEGKIDEEELKQLIVSKDVDIDLEWMIPDQIRNPYANANYVFINNLW